MDDAPSTLPPKQAPIPPVIIGLGGVTPAPMFQRIVALLLDTSLAGLAAFIILTRVVFPQYHPDAANTMAKQWQSFEKEIQSAETSGAMPQFTYDDEALNVVADAGKTFFLTMLVYFFTSELVTDGSTLGKKAFGLRAARRDTGAPPTFLESFSRCLFKVGSFIIFCPILLVVNTIPVFIQSNRRAGHDRLANTIVTNDAPPPRPKHADEEWS